MKTIEEWKVIEDFPEYEVSSFGRIKRSNKFLTPTKKSDGYFKINLRLNKVPKTVYVHRIVAKAFVENPNSRVIDRPTKRCKGYKIISDIIYK